MPLMTPARYGSFWYVPRAIVLHHRRLYLLMKSDFDEGLDDDAANDLVDPPAASIGPDVSGGKREEICRSPFDGDRADFSHIGSVRRNQAPGLCLDGIVEKQRLRNDQRIS